MAEMRRRVWSIENSKHIGSCFGMRR